MDDLIISQPMRFTVDVKNGLVERPQRESLMRGDKMANRIIAELVNGSETFDITGVTVKGKFCRPPSGDEIDLAGEAKGNVATVQLTDQCYTSGGHYEARVILVLGGVERTVLFISGDVLKSGSGNAAGDEETGGSGGTGSGLPAGGTDGQVLVKVSSAQGDAIWKNLTADDVGARPDNWMPTAADVGARPADWMPTAADVGALPSSGTAANAIQLNGKSADQYMLKTDTAANSAKLGGKAPEYYLKPRNLLDNSDFRNPVNQRGQTSYSSGAWGYCIDRWMTYSSTATITESGIEISGSSRNIIGQRISLDSLKKNTEDYVFVYCDANDVVHFSPHKYKYDNYWEFWIESSETIVIKWAALYEGSYTADTLPPYVPKGYAAELAECQRYYQKYKFSNTSSVALGLCYSETKARFTVTIPPMRATPNVMFETPTEHVPYVSVEGNVVAKGNLNCTALGVKYGRVISLDVSITGGITNMPAILMTNSSASLVLSADL